MELISDETKKISPGCGLAILLASYNGEKYIASQIDSILEQTFSSWELYIHDDGSKDGTVEIIRKYEKNYPEKIHLLDYPPTGGARNNFFSMMSKVTADHIMFCDQDDVWCSDKIEKTISAMEKAEKENGIDMPILVFGDLYVVDEELKIISGSMNRYQKLDPERIRPEQLMLQNVVTGCTMMINKSLAQLSEKCSDISNVIMHDWWCALIAARFGRLVYIDSPMLYYRQHNDNSIGASHFGLSYILEKLSKPSGIRRSLKNTRIQAKCFSESFSLDKDELLSRYGELEGLGKLSRLSFYRKNGIKKNSLARNAGLWIFG